MDEEMRDALQACMRLYVQSKAVDAVIETYLEQDATEEEIKNLIERIFGLSNVRAKIYYDSYIQEHSDDALK